LIMFIRECGGARGWHGWEVEQRDAWSGMDIGDNLSLSPLFDGEYLILYTLMLHLTFNRQHGRLYDKCVENRGVGNLRLLAFHLLDSLLTTTTSISICPHMTSFSTKMDITRVALAKLLPMNISFQ